MDLSEIYAGQYKLEVEAKYEAEGEDTLSSKQEIEFEVQRLYSNTYSFALVKIDRTVETWGDEPAGGDPTSPTKGVKCGTAARGLDISCLSGVKEIFSTDSAFAAVKTDGTIVTWGHDGGDSSSVSGSLTNVKEIFSNVFSFAVLKNDGTVVTWGTQIRVVTLAVFQDPSQMYKKFSQLIMHLQH